MNTDFGMSDRAFRNALENFERQFALMSSYNVSFVDGILKIGFGASAQNDVSVRDADQRCCELIRQGVLMGGEILRINGPASLPVAMVLAHRFGHLYGVVACFDPILAQYVVVISHSPAHKVGDLIP